MSLWNKILEKVVKIINIIKNIWNKIISALAALAGDLTVTFNDDEEGYFVYKLDRYQSEILEALKYCASTLEIGSQILNMTDPGEKLNTLTDVANKAKAANEGFNSHTDEAKAYCQRNKGYKVTGTIFKKKIDLIKPHIDKLETDLENISKIKNANGLSNPDASKEITRCIGIVTTIVSPITIRLQGLLPIINSVTNRISGTADSIKTQILAGKKIQVRDGFPIISIQNAQFPSTWHFDDNDHSNKVDDIRKKYNKSTMIVVNENIFNRMSADGRKFILEHEVGHAKEYDDGTLSGQADLEGEKRADAYAVNATGFSPDQVQKIFDQAYDICKRGIVPKVDIVRLKKIFDARIKVIRENYNSDNNSSNNENATGKAAFIGYYDSELGLTSFEDLFS